jgi:hypothetical protein
VLKAAFLKDLLSLLSWAPLMINCVVIDKVEAKKKGWIQKDKFIKETSYSLLKNFILMTCAKGKVKGKIMIESSSEKDPYYLKAFNHYLANGIKDTQVTQTDVKKALTSMTFVTKNNHDIESQLADLFAYAAKCQYLHSTKSKKVKKGSYEEKLVKIFDRKLYSMDPKVSTKKQTLLKKVTSFLVLP